MGEIHTQVFHSALNMFRGQAGGLGIKVGRMFTASILRGLQRYAHRVVTGDAQGNQQVLWKAWLVEEPPHPNPLPEGEGEPQCRDKCRANHQPQTVPSPLGRGLG
ncbi:hypothetical protein D3C76_680200 [compost metagenome]